MNNTVCEKLCQKVMIPGRRDLRIKIFPASKFRKYLTNRWRFNLKPKMLFKSQIFKTKTNMRLDYKLDHIWAIFYIFIFLARVITIIWQQCRLKYLFVQLFVVGRVGQLFEPWAPGFLCLESLSQSCIYPFVISCYWRYKDVNSAIRELEEEN